MEVWQLIGVAMVQHELGHKAESDAALERLHQQYADDAAFNIGYVHAFRNEADAAFEWLERARRNGDPASSRSANEPMFARVHSDLRWHALLARLGRAPEDLAAIDFTVRRPGKVPVSKPLPPDPNRPVGQCLPGPLISVSFFPAGFGGLCGLCRDFLSRSVGWCRAWRPVNRGGARAGRECAEVDHGVSAHIVSRTAQQQRRDFLQIAAHENLDRPRPTA